MSVVATTLAHEVPPQAGPRAFLHRLRQGDEIAHLITLIFAALISNLVLSAQAQELRILEPGQVITRECSDAPTPSSRCRA